ncbi:hypothetical protein L596_007025 [Steinernema carpocapsae]|uniref:Secreted protein n=1 Tax=Steinernema carpocapsae TaxID=34508 RepID=A0A4U5P905_STECR|nr:hypothetical protein L596_007025 [Steinernema carpocapsae]
MHNQLASSFVVIVLLFSELRIALISADVTVNERKKRAQNIPSAIDLQLRLCPADFLGRGGSFQPVDRLIRF